MYEPSFAERQMVRDLLLELCPSYMSGINEYSREAMVLIFARCVSSQIRNIRDQYETYCRKPENHRKSGNVTIQKPSFRHSAEYKRTMARYIHQTTGIKIPFSPNLPAHIYKEAGERLEGRGKAL